MTTVQVAEPARRMWTRDEYYRMGELGWFENQRTELIGGEIVVVSPQEFRHFAALDKAAEQSGPCSSLTQNTNSIGPSVHATMS